MQSDTTQLATDPLDFADDCLREAQTEGDPVDLTALGERLRATGQLDAAARCLEAVLRRDPTRWDTACALVMTLLDQNRADAARVLLDALQVVHPDRAERHYIALQAFPIVYRTSDELAFYRETYRRDLARLEAAASAMSVHAQVDLIRAVSEHGNFFVHYQGYHERADQTTFGGVVDGLARRLFTPFRDMRPAARTRPRVGYISSSFKRHTVCKLVRGFIEHRDPARVEVYVYQLGPDHDTVTDAVARASDRFTHLPFSPTDIVDIVRADALDVLVFTDIGMLGLASVLAAARLAPVQCVFWGHPITTGIAAADWFVSSAVMEPASGATHYTERLLPLAGMPVAYARPNVPPPLDRRQLGFNDDDVIYLCCQSLFKYLPQFDDLYARIASAVPEARFVFLAHRTQPVTAAFLARLTRAFAARGVDVRQRVRVLPSLTEQSYLALNATADVFLDTPGWSGGNTCLEALAADLPVVTMPGATMRSRHSAGFLTVLGLDELIAESEDDYVKLGIRLGSDAAYRQATRAFIRANADSRVFGRTECVREFEDAIVEWTETSRA